jgi:hypothetical protein
MTSEMGIEGFLPKFGRRGDVRVTHESPEGTGWCEISKQESSHVEWEF